MQRFLATIASAGLVLLGGLAIGCGQKPKSESSRATPEQPSAATAAAYDLSRDEDRGGHTLRKHVGRTDDELRQRLERERDISASSTWTDRSTAEQTVGEALRAERRKIENWTDRGWRRPNLALHFAAGRKIGRSLLRGAAEPVPCASAIIVLRADGDGFYVLTAYPEARE
jgi:toxin YxiD